MVFGWSFLEFFGMFDGSFSLFSIEILWLGPSASR